MPQEIKALIYVSCSTALGKADFHSIPCRGWNEIVFYIPNILIYK